MSEAEAKVGTGREQADPGRKYRLHAQSDLRREEGTRIVGLETMVEVPAASAPEHRAKGRLASFWSTSRAEILLGVFTAVSFALAAVLVAEGSSLLSRAQLALVALVPLTAVAAFLGWLDRWAPIGRRYKIYAVAWGGGIAALGAIVVNSTLFLDLLKYSGSEDKATLATSVAVAPIAEELFKGLGVILILVLARHRLTSALGAVALAGLVGAGFAYLENLEYFWQSWQEGSTVFGFTVFARAIMSPFVHPMATSFVGLAAGAALIRLEGWWGWTWRLLLGYGGAVAVHALWNGLASLGAVWIVWYFLLELPLFIAWMVALVIWSGKLSRAVAEGLVPYVETGWVSPSEVQLVLNPAARKTARKWARRLGAPAPKLLRQFRRDLGFVAMDQQLMTKYGYREERVELDRKYLQDAVATREELAALELVRGAAASAGAK